MYQAAVPPGQWFGHRLAGFWLGTQWFWQRPLPPTRGIVERILSDGA